jgi:hypothetical protein
MDIHSNISQLGTQLSGVIHVGLQAKATNNPFSSRFFVKLPQLMFCFNRQIHNPKHLVSFAMYPQGTALESNAVLQIIGPQLSLNTPSPFHFRSWSWAPLQNIHGITIFEQNGPGYIGMIIGYKNGGMRFIGDLGRCRMSECRRSFTKTPKRMYIERWPVPFPFCQRMPMRVNFGPRDIRHSIHTEYNEYDLEGELHFWCGPMMRPEIRVLPSGSWRSSDEIN